MDPVGLFLVAVAAIFLIGAVGEMIFERTSIPDVIWLIGAGVVIGPVLGWVTRAELHAVAPYFAALTLVVILFEGGTRIRLKELSQVAPRAGLLALLTFAVSVVLIAAATMGLAELGWGLPVGWTWLHGLLVGCILGGPSSIIIMPAMQRARLPSSLANLVGLESALTDALCVVGTSAIINIMVTGPSEAGSPAGSLAKSFGLAVLIGLVAGLAWLVCLRLIKNQEHAYPITLAMLLLLYVAIEEVGGSAALGILTVAIVLGNAPSISKKFELGEGFELGRDVRRFHSNVAFIIKSFFFTFMGMMLGPPWTLVLLGAALGLVIPLARFPGTALATVGKSFDRPARAMVLVCMPRGMAAGVLATMPFFAGVALTEHLPVLVFPCVLATILMFAVGFPLVRRRLPPPEEPATSERPALPQGSGPDPGFSEPSPPAVEPVPPIDEPALTAPDSDLAIDVQVDSGDEPQAG